jgi:hypothetical protein
MRIQVPSASRIPVLLLFSAAGLVAVCAFLYVRLDMIVNSDLYRFGLQFSPEWYENYQAGAKLILISFSAVALVNFAAALYLLASHIGKISPKRWGVATLLVVGICAAVSSVAFFFKLDTIVHSSLYQFGLRFSEEWATLYWMDARLLLGLVGILMCLDGASLAYTISAGSILSISSGRLVSIFLLLIGGGALAYAFFYESSVFAFVGLGFILWGVVMLYAGSKRYIEESMLSTFMLPVLVDLDRLLQDLGCKGRAFFLPPKYVNDFESSRMYISTEESVNLPQPRQILGRENTILLKEPAGVIIEPPGAELTRLLEKKLGVKFTKTDLRFLQRGLPNAFAEKLQLAKSLEVSVEKDMVRVTINDFAFRDVFEKVRSLTHVYGKIGSPVASAIGCALAKASGELVVIDREVMSQGDHNILIEYRILRTARGGD